MPDCGQDADYDALKDYLTAIAGVLIPLAQGNTLVIKAVGNLALLELENHLRSWLTEFVVQIPGASMLPDILSVVALAQAVADDPSIVKTMALNAAKAELQVIYGEAVTLAGAEVDDLITDILKGAVPCELVPNIVTNSSGNVVEIAKKPLTIKGPAEPEDPPEKNSAGTALLDKINIGLVKTIADSIVSRHLYESQMNNIFKNTNPLTEAIEPNMTPGIFWQNVEELQKLDRFINVQKIISSPSIVKHELESIRQGTSLQGPNALSKPVLPVLDPQTQAEWELQAKKTAQQDDYRAEQSALFTTFNKQSSSIIQALSYAQRLEKYKNKEGSGYISLSDYIEANPL